MINPKFLSLLFSLFLAGLSGCASYNVLLVQPQSGATVRCRSEGVAIMAGGAEGFIEECLKRYEGQGYVREDKLTLEQRIDMEKRGVLPKSEPPTFHMGY